MCVCTKTAKSNILAYAHTPADIVFFFFFSNTSQVIYIIAECHDSSPSPASNFLCRQFVYSFPPALLTVCEKNRKYLTVE